MGAKQILIENVDEVLAALGRRVGHADAHFLADGQQELGRRHARVEDERDLGVLRSLREQRPHHRRLAGADFAGELHEAARLIDAIQQMSQGFGVALAQIEIARIRSDRERLFIETEKRQIHEKDAT